MDGRMSTSSPLSGRKKAPARSCHSWQSDDHNVSAESKPLLVLRGTYTMYADTQARSLQQQQQQQQQPDDDDDTSQNRIQPSALSRLAASRAYVCGTVHTLSGLSRVE